MDIKAAPRLNSLTGLRAVAAIAVLAWHGKPDNLAHSNPIAPLFNAGQSGVLFFFLLSGFVLTWVQSRDDTVKSFYWRRVARVAPNHLATWAVAVIAGVVIGHSIGLPEVSSLFMVQAWVPNMHFYFSANTVAWSLSCEMFFYAMFPLIIGPLSRLRRVGRRWLFALLVVAIASLELTAWSLAGSAVTQESSFAVWLVYIFPLTRFLEFALGILVASEMRHGHSWNIGFWPAAALAAAAYYVGGMFPSVTVASWLMIIPFLLLIAAAASRDINGRGTLFSHRWFVWAGDGSFAFYLTHTLFIQISHALHLSSAIGAVVNLTFGLVGAWALYKWVERPAEKKIRARFAHRGERTSLTPAAITG